MITRDHELHARNIEAINARNDAADESSPHEVTLHAWRMIGYHNGKYLVTPRTDLKGAAALAYGEGYRAASIAFEYTKEVACR